MSKKYEIYSGSRVVSVQYSVSPLQATLDYVRSLGTTDADGAQRFYEEVFGWTTTDMGSDFGSYRIFDRVGGTGQGHAGLMQNQNENIPAMWTPYVGVEDTDAICAKAKELGANAIVEPMDVPTVGRFAVIADPQGAVFGVIKGEPAS